VGDIIDALRDRRVALNLSQREVGTALGLSSPQGDVSRWERKRVSPSAETLEAWAKVLGVVVVLQISIDTTPEGE
jgi:transcriptional regulator with XRE-family HTH domain